MYNLIFREEAVEELQDAYDWYESKKIGLGERFLRLIDDYIKILEKSPESYQTFYKKKRALFLKEFPYQIIYGIYNKEVVIYSFFHARRNPRIWKRRK